MRAANAGAGPMPVSTSRASSTSRRRTHPSGVAAARCWRLRCPAPRLAFSSTSGARYLRVAQTLSRMMRSVSGASCSMFYMPKVSGSVMAAQATPKQADSSGPAAGTHSSTAEPTAPKKSSYHGSCGGGTGYHTISTPRLVEMTAARSMPPHAYVVVSQKRGCGSGTDAAARRWMAQSPRDAVSKKS